MNLSVATAYGLDGYAFIDVISAAHFLGEFTSKGVDESVVCPQSLFGWQNAASFHVELTTMFLLSSVAAALATTMKMVMMS